jgi:hypothetical protein
MLPRESMKQLSPTAALPVAVYYGKVCDGT